jgi:hypothetical protein
MKGRMGVMKGEDYGKDEMELNGYFLPCFTNHL